MPREIKTRRPFKDIKALDKAASSTAHIKNAFIRSKQSAESTQDPQHHSVTDYVTDRSIDGANSVVQKSVNRTRNPQKRAIGKLEKAKAYFQEAKQHLPKQRKQEAEQAHKAAVQSQKTANALEVKAKKAQKTEEQAKKAVVDAKNNLQRTRQSGRQAIQTAKHTQKTATQAKTAVPDTKQTLQHTRPLGSQTVHAAKRSAKAGKQSDIAINSTAKTAKITGKGTIKTVKQSVKTAERTAHAAVKTAQRTAKTAQHTAKATAKTARLATRVSNATAKAAAVTTKAAVKSSIAMIKVAIAAIKGLVTLIIAGGWIAVLTVIVICLIGLMTGSVYGIFFSGEDSGSSYTMPMAIAEINNEYEERLAEIRSKNKHDEVVISGTRVMWKDIFTVYAVKVNTDPEIAQDVATMDEQKKELLRSVFWDMNVITHRTTRATMTETIVTDDGKGNFIETKESVTKTVLYIKISGKSDTEISEQYGFSEQQKAQFLELLSDQYADLWSTVLYGVRNGSSDIVEVAISQIGNVGGKPYWSWYGFNSRVAWCATFVSWCANECGYLEAGIIPKFAACQNQGIPWFKKHGLWQDSSYVPKPGDIIFFDWGQDGYSDHVGIVEYVDGVYVHTVEGNTSNSCARRKYRLNSRSIVGYGCPLY